MSRFNWSQRALGPQFPSPILLGWMGDLQSPRNSILLSHKAMVAGSPDAGFRAEIFFHLFLKFHKGKTLHKIPNLHRMFYHVRVLKAPLNINKVCYLDILQLQPGSRQHSQSQTGDFHPQVHSSSLSRGYPGKKTGTSDSSIILNKILDQFS